METKENKWKRIKIRANFLKMNGNTWKQIKIYFRNGFVKRKSM